MDDDHFDDDIVIVNAPQSPTTGSTQSSHGFVGTTYGAVDTHFGPGVDFTGFDFGPGFVNTHPLYNEADIFTVSPLMLCDLRTLLRCQGSGLRRRVGNAKKKCAFLIAKSYGPGLKIRLH